MGECVCVHGRQTRFLGIRPPGLDSVPSAGGGGDDGAGAGKTGYFVVGLNPSSEE